MNLGRHKLGDSIGIVLKTVDEDGVATDPDHPPLLHVYNSSGTVILSTELALARPRATGLFFFPLFLGSEFSTGYYTAEVFYDAGDNYGIDSHQFQVVPGGNQEGAIHSLYYFKKPGAAFLVQSTESGTIIKGKNPSI